MVRDFEIHVDGITYNVTKLSAMKAVGIQQNLLELLSDLGDFGTTLSGNNEEDLDFVKILSCIGHVPEHKLTSLLKTLFDLVRCPCTEQEAKDRFKVPGKVNLDHFLVDDLMTVYKIAWEVLKENFGNFLGQLKQNDVFNNALAQAQ